MLQPVGKRLLVKPVEEKHGTLLVTNQKPFKFLVVNIGEEITQIKVGQTVFIEKHYGVAIEHENEKFLVVDESSVLAKLD